MKEIKEKGEFFEVDLPSLTPLFGDLNPNQRIQGVCLTVTRKKYLNKILLQSKAKRSAMFMLSGCEGIGKSFTLIYLVYLFKNSCIRDKIKCIYVPNCLQITMETLLEEIYRVFDSAEDKITITKTIEKFELEIGIQGALRKLIKKYNENGFLTVMIWDQLNSLDRNLNTLFLNVTQLNWELQVFSQSSTNDTNPKLKIFYRKCINKNFDNLIENKDIEKLILNDKKYLNLHLEDSDFKEIFELVSTNPRETYLILNSEGKTLNEKISNYILQRGIEIKEIHSKFLRAQKQKTENDIMKSIFYMDKGYYPKNEPNPMINRQFMNFQPTNKPNEASFIIYSCFPFAGRVLKETLTGDAIDLNFYEKRINECLDIMNRETNGSTYGNVYENYVHTVFRKFIWEKKKGKLNIVPSAQLLNKKNKSEVFKLFFNHFYFLIS